MGNPQETERMIKPLFAVTFAQQPLAFMAS